MQNRIFQESIDKGSLRRLTITALFLVTCFCAIAQIRSKDATGTFASEKVQGTPIQWSEPVTELKFDGSVRRYLMFDGAVYLDDTSLPHVISTVKTSSATTVDAELKELRFEPLSLSEEEAVENLVIPKQVVAKVENYTERKQSFARVSFIPLRKNPTTGRVEKLTSYKLTTRSVALSGPKAAGTHDYASSSVLSSGSWYKVAIPADGIYRLTYNDLEALGMDPGSIDPRRINIYGNGGGMLPQPNNVFRHDDLQQNAIEVVGESDGRFDPGDYVIFYAKGPHTWVQDSTKCGLFRHDYNVYSDRSYYFITVDQGMGRRVQLTSQTGRTPTHTANTFVDYQFHEVDNMNLLKSGREWFGEEFDIQTSHSFDFNFSNVANVAGHLGTRVLAKSLSGATSFTIRKNGATVESVNVPQVSGGYNKNAEDEFTCTELSVASGNTNIAINYSKGGNPNAVGWLDYIDIILTRNLSITGGQMAFRNLQTVGFGNVTEFQISNASSALKLWEVTDPVNVSRIDLTLQGSAASFKVETDSLRQFVAFNGSSFLSPELVGAVPNQNLHGLSQADMVIVAHPNFLSEAQRLKNFHEQNETSSLSVHIVTPEQIYNEFSSGAQDVTAIRDFMKMFYDRSTIWQDMPRYLLLFGDASYDYKDRLADNTNFVPTYESPESLTPTISYASDDYFGLLDANEGAWGSSASDALDIGIGRFVVRTLDDARAVVDKIYRYEELDVNSAQVDHACAAGSGNAIISPDWRNRIVFVADDEDSNMHLNQADQLAVLVDTMYPEYNLTKIYMDAYVQESTPGGQRYPEVTTSLNNEVQRGALIVNYTGHGGELGWAHERILGVTDINGWTNFGNLPVFVTATCEFTRYDDPSRISAGEWVHLNPDGGGIALFTTSRLVYSAPNFTLNRNFYLNLLTEQLWGPPTMGDVIRMTKVASGGSVNNRNFSLIGDPAQRLAFPLHRVQTLTINGDDVNSLTDTINALQLVTVTGTMRDRNGQTMPDFNGIVYPTVFDKATQVSTLGNDPGSSVRQFSVQKNLIYKGKASVTDGNFSFSFVVPRDIAYNYDFGRISYYAESTTTNANGYFEEFVIGGSNDNAASDNVGPEIRLYMNDENFAYGGTTDENPSLYALVSDSNGINTVGNGIGHDITAVLNDNTNNTFNLNDFYEADLNSYQSGKVVYPFSKLSEGTHNLRLKVWDVYNNSSEAYTEFVVAESAELALEHVLNYPNPFTTRTSFMFEHNQPCNSLDVQVQIFTVSGKLVKTINETVLSQGFRNDPIEWDGLDDYGQKIGRGVYLYNLKVTTPDGQKAEQIERLVILN